ncbi:MAG: hypothetical protein ACREVE_10450 [Gammaproteobacteria bacterium]
MTEFAADDITPPWLVYEWYVVEALVRNRKRLQAQHGVPGIRKVATAIQNRRAIGAASYLKTPTVFGFSGVFRRLARHLRILTDDGRLDDAGCDLVLAWEKDQKLPGFLNASSGAGACFREGLRRAVQQGMHKGHTTPQSVEFWKELTDRLDPGCAGPAEKKMLLKLIGERAGKPEHIRCIIGALKAQKRPLTYPEEAGFLRALASRAPVDLVERLSAIDTYEAFCRPVTYAFEWIRHLSTTLHSAPVGVKEFAECQATKRVANRIRVAVRRATDHDPLMMWERAFKEDVLPRFRHVKDAKDVFHSVVEHHKAVQRDKPPEGKRTWIEEGRAGTYFVRPDYSVPNVPSDRADYVHEYRLPTFSRFLADLGALT